MKIRSFILVKSTCTSSKDLKKLFKSVLIDSSLPRFKLKSWDFLQVMFLQDRPFRMDFLQISKWRFEKDLLQEATLKRKEELWKLLVLMGKLSKVLLSLLLNLVFLLLSNRWIKWEQRVKRWWVFLKGSWLLRLILLPFKLRKFLLELKDNDLFALIVEEWDIP